MGLSARHDGAVLGAHAVEQVADRFEAAPPRVGVLQILVQPPFLAGTDDSTRAKEYTERLRALLDADRRGDAVAAFMNHVGIPEQMIAGIRAYQSAGVDHVVLALNTGDVARIRALMEDIARKVMPQFR